MAKRSGRRRCLVLMMVVALSSNCSLSRGRTQLVHVTSTPPDAQVSLNGEPVGETPMYVEVRRRDADPVLRIGKAGFESVESGLDRRLSRWFLGGDLVGALFLGGFAWAIASLDYGPSSPRSIGYGALWSTPVLAPPLVLGTAFAFPNEVEVVLERADGGGDPVGGLSGSPYDRCSKCVRICCVFMAGWPTARRAPMASGSACGRYGSARPASVVGRSWRRCRKGIGDEGRGVSSSMLGRRARWGRARRGVVETEASSRLGTAADHADSPRVAMVNRTLAERLWPGRPAGGQILNGAIVNRAAGRASLAEPPRRRAGAHVPAYRRSPSDAGATRHVRRMQALALLLLMDGLYAVLTMTVDQRTRELAIRWLSCCVG